MLPPSNNKPTQAQRNFMILSGIALSLPWTIGGLAGLGYWLDLRYQTKPWLTLVGLIIGLVSVTVEMYWYLYKVKEQHPKKTK
jgi:F0F1-type ATP synthase assembly protein I